jgi:hypothetical protein
MPVKLDKDKEGCYAVWGSSGKKYYYPCNDEVKKNKAKKLAYLQGLVIGDYKNK